MLPLIRYELGLNLKISLSFGSVIQCDCQEQKEERVNAIRHRSIVVLILVGLTGKVQQTNGRSTKANDDHLLSRTIHKTALLMKNSSATQPPSNTDAPSSEDVHRSTVPAENEVLLQRLQNELAQKNRELLLEASLEKVRSRAMDMNYSFELSDVLSVLFEQYDHLGICPVFSHLTLFDLENRRFAFRTTGRGGQRVQAEQKIDLDAMDTWKEAVENWKRGGPEQVHSHHYPPEILPQVFGLFQEILSVIPEEARYTPEDFPAGVFITQGYCRFGYVGFGHSREATLEEKEVVRRMAREFERLYQRFIDLEKVEDQIRDAQVEASMERVRAGALAMRNSADVGNATGILFTELEKLGMSPLRCGLYIIDEKDVTMQVWRATTTTDGTIGQVTGTVSMTIHPMLQAGFDAWQRKDATIMYTLEGEDLAAYYKALIEHAPQFVQNVATGKQISTSFFFDEGALFVFTREPLDATTCSLMKKFASVFSLTYRRYLDLKIAERQTREAIRQASLDRVRAEIASMRTTADLEKITPLIWNELNSLGVPFIRCGVFIMDAQQKVAHTYLSTPDGKAVASFDLPYDSPGSIAEIVSRWEKKEFYAEYWDQKSYLEFADELVKHGVLVSVEQYLRSLPRGGFYIHFAPFLQGMLYVGNTTLFGQEQEQVVRLLAEAFSTAYARYEDFSQLEAAKKQVDKTLVELKQAQQQLIQSEKMASLGQLTAGIAHEIRNPLNFVNNFSEANKELLEELRLELKVGHVPEALVLTDSLLDNEQKISHHGKRAGTIVNTMLQHARSHTGKKDWVAINDLAAEYLEMSYRTAKERYPGFEVNILTHYDPAVTLIRVVAQEIGRVLLNLFDNAFYSLQEKKEERGEAFQPELRVTTQQEKNQLLLQIKDNGTGMSPEIASRIFQPFFTTKPAGEGTGLGLSLSYDVVTKGHGGTLSVESNEGEGSLFSIRLPIQ